MLAPERQGGSTQAILLLELLRAHDRCNNPVTPPLFRTCWCPPPRRGQPGGALQPQWPRYPLKALGEVGNCLLNSLRLSINRRGGSSPLRFVERQDEGRSRGCAPVPGQGIGAPLPVYPPCLNPSQSSSPSSSSPPRVNSIQHLCAWTQKWTLRVRRGNPD